MAMYRPENGGQGVPPASRETPHDRAVRTAAQEAWVWIQRGEFERDASAIWRAIRNAGLENNRTTYDQVKAALHESPEWKEMKRKEREDKEQRKELAAERTRQTMREAYAHQMRQPRDAWDPFADEKDED